MKQKSSLCLNRLLWTENNLYIRGCTVRCYLLLLLALSIPVQAIAGVIFVDNTLSSDCSSYNYTTRQCSGGTYRAYKNLKGAADVAVAGDTVVIRGGNYNEQLAPTNSGTEDKPILFAAFNNEQVVISGASLAPAVWIYQRAYITLQGITVNNVQRWMAVLGSHHIIIRFNNFSNANDAGGSSKTGLFFQESHHNIVQNNVIDNSTQDNLAFVHCHHNLVEGNRITRAAHTLWALKCSSYNILRGNYFHNQYQKIGEIYDCDNVGYGDLSYNKITIADSTKFNVVEGNVFAYTSTPINASPYAGIQHAGQYCLIRRNIFYNCLGPGIDLTLYADEARNNYGNKVYNNVFFKNEFGGISVSGVKGNGYNFHDNYIFNNIFYQNKFSQYDTRWQWYSSLKDKALQIMTGRTSDVVFVRNNLLNSTPGELWTIAYGDRTSSTNPPPQTLSWWEANYPTLFIANMESEPLFTDTAKRDFHLLPTSRLIDSAAFMGVVASDGSGTVLPVTNATYFCDGFGISRGDTIQLQGESSYALIQQIDYAKNTLTLDRELQWHAKQGIALKYEGKGPDLGAFESPSVLSAVEQDREAQEGLALYPNPGNGMLYLKGMMSSAPVYSISVNTALGETVFEQKADVVNILNMLSEGIDLRGLSAGVYYVRVYAANATSVLVYIKE